MTNTENTTTQPQMIAATKLERSPLNVRKTLTQDGIEEMKASLLAHGLMQNLVVYEAGAGMFHVVAGGRRLQAIRALIAEGKLPSDYTVPCQLVTEEHAQELSLAENTVRLAMHPADQFEAFNALIVQGQTATGVAERFGVEVSLVLKRMKLARVAPELVAAYRDEELSLECLMAFTLTDDHDRQRHVYESLAYWQKESPDAIRACLTEQMIDSDNRLARFVGLDAYTAAGGTRRTDLFREEVYLENAELLHRLAAEKLEAKRQGLLAEGWQWVEAGAERDWNLINGCGRIRAKPVDAPQALLDQKEALEAELEEFYLALEDAESDTPVGSSEEAEGKLTEIEEQLDSFSAFDANEMRFAGCCVWIGHDGSFGIEKGLVRREDMKQLAGPGDERPAKPKGMPDSLRRDLESYRLQAAQLEIARHRLIALDLLAFTFARQILVKRPHRNGLGVRFEPQLGTFAVQQQRTAASDALKAIADKLPRAWLNQETEAEQFQAFIGLSDKEKLDFVAYGVAMSLPPQLSTGDPNTACEVAFSLTDADVAGYWRPNKANYLGRITRDQLLALGRELFGEAWSQARSRDKKGELADTLERVFAEPEKHARSPEQLVKLFHWLPAGMAFGPAESPVTEDSERQAA